MLRPSGSSRPSSRSSFLPGSSASSSAESAQARLADKKKELANLNALDTASADILAQIQVLVKQNITTASGSERFREVLTSWHHMFHLVSTLAEPRPDTPSDSAADDPKLVRLDLDLIPAIDGSSKP